MRFDFGLKVSIRTLAEPHLVSPVSILPNPSEFEKKHKHRGISGERMSAWRFKIIGAKARPFGWWKKPEVLKLLLSEEKSLNQVRAELTEQISTSQVARLRWQAKRAYQIRNGKLLPTADGLEQ